MGSFLDFWNSAKKQTFGASGTTYQNTYTEEAKKNLWERSGLDPEKFDINAFDKNGAGMYIKPMYQTDQYKKATPQIAMPQDQNTSSQTMTGGGMTMGGQPSAPSISASTNPALQEFSKQIEDDALFSQMDKDLGLDDQTFAEMDQVALGTPEKKEWNDNIIPTFSDESKFKSNEDDGNIETSAKWLGNAGMSLWNIVGGLGNVVANPYDTGKSVVDIAHGTVGVGVNATVQGLNKLGIVSDETAQRADRNINNDETVKLAKAVGGAIINPYTSVDNFKETIWSDPARIVGDVLSVVSGGAGAVTKLSNVEKANLIAKVKLATTLEQKSALIQNAVQKVQLAKTAERISTISNKMNPYIFAPTLALNGGKAIVGGVGSSIGSTIGYGVSQITGFNPMTIKEIVNNPLWKKTKAGVLTEEGLTDDLGNAINMKKLEISDLGSGYDVVRNGKATVKIDPNMVDEVFQKAGIQIKDGKFDFSKTNMGSKSDFNAIQEAYDLVKTRLGNGEISSADFLNLRQAIDDTVGWDAKTTSKAEKIVKDIRGMIDAEGKKQIPGLKDLDTTYAEKLRKYKQIESDWLTADIENGGKRLKDTALTKIINSDKRGRERIFQELDELIPGVSDRIKAVNALRDVQWAGGQKVGTYTRSLALSALTFSGGGIVPAVATFILTNPRVSTVILEAYGTIAKVPKKVLQGISNKIEQGIRLIAPERKILEDVEKVGYSKIYSAMKKSDQAKMPPPNVGLIQKELLDMSQEYNKYQGLDPIYDFGYLPVNKTQARSVAKNYDELQSIAKDPQTQQAYKALEREVQLQWDFFESKGYKFEPWKRDGQPYANSAEMIDDVARNKHLYFFQGGEPHPLLGTVGKDGLSANDKLRAIHDLLGHAMKGYQFGPRGEENAFLKHAQMFSDDAVKALATETRGQNSWVNFGKQNYDPKTKEYLNIKPSERPYAEQKVAILDEANRNPFAKIHDMNFKREGAFAKFLDPKANYMITTAYNPMARSVDEAVNVANQTKLKEWLTKNKYEWKEQLGKYDNEEKSLLIKIRSSADQMKIDKFVESFTPQEENLRIVGGKAYHYNPRDYSETWGVDLRRHKVRILDDNVDNYYSEIDGKKYQLPLYDEATEFKVDNFEEMLKSNRKTMKQFLGKESPMEKDIKALAKESTDQQDFVYKVNALPFDRAKYQFHGTQSGDELVKAINGSKADVRLSDGMFGKGFYLAPEPHVARSFGMDKLVQNGDGMGWREKAYDKADVVMVDLSKAKMKVLDYGNQEFYDFLDKQKTSPDGYIAKLKKEGFDGLYLTSRGESILWNLDNVSASNITNYLGK